MADAYHLQSGISVSDLSTDARATFITRTYTHLLGAIIAFTLIEITLFTNGMAEAIAQAMLGHSWLLALGGFMVVAWLASRVAHTATSTGAQYGALAAFVCAEAILFVPLLFIAQAYAPGVIQSAASVTLLGFGGLTAVAMTSRKDFTFLASVLKWGGVMALLIIVAGLLFGFQLGTWFSIAMIAFAGGAILYDTSNVLYHYPEDRYIAASLELFASVALLFWYVLRLLIASRD